MDKPTYIIVVVGSFDAGKYTFINTIGGYASFAQINLDTETLYLIPAPDTRRFDFVLELFRESHFLGVVVMLDSTQPKHFLEAKFIAQTYEAYSSLPYIYAANFQDHPDAWDIESLRIALRIPPRIPIVPCIAYERESVKNVLITLLETVLNR